MDTKAGQLTPPELFGIVEHNVFRSGMIQDVNYSYILTLKLKSVLYLSQDYIPKPLIAFFDEHNIKIQNAGNSNLNHHHPYASPLSEDAVKEALEFILNSYNHPVLIMDSAGIHETGIIVGCLRKLQHWNFNSISCEYRSYAAVKGRTMIEHFINLFDLDLVNIPLNPPSWYTYQQTVLKEEKRAYKEQQLNLV